MLMQFLLKHQQQKSIYMMEFRVLGKFWFSLLSFLEYVSHSIFTLKFYKDSSKFV